MAKPQQAELRRSGTVPALDPDATESDLEAHRRPGDSGPQGPIPPDQRPGHRPDHDQDKPDLDDFAARLGVVADEEEPDEAPHVTAGSRVTRLAPKAERRIASGRSPGRSRPAWSPVGLMLVPPVAGFLAVRGVLRALRGRKDRTRGD